MNPSEYVSVVIPVYDRLPVLELVLDFFTFQDYRNDRFEIVVVDDGSEEHIGDALGARSFPFTLRVLTQRNRGRAAARNAGIHAARGDLILFCDADRIPHPELISAHAEAHRRYNNVAVVGTPWDCFLPFAKIRKRRADALPDMIKWSRLPPYYQIMRQLLPKETSISSVGWAAFLVGNASVRREVLIAAGGFDEDLTTWGFEHFDLGWRMANRCSIAVCNLAGGGSFHMPHSRDLRHLRAGIDHSVAATAAKASGSALALLREFMFARISLQEFELRYSGAVSSTIETRAPIFFQQLAFKAEGES